MISVEQFILKHVLANESRAVKAATLAKLRTSAGCDQTRIKLYHKYAFGTERLEAIHAFSQGLNVLGLFPRLKSEGVNDKLLLDYLQELPASSWIQITPLNWL